MPPLDVSWNPYEEDDFTSEAKEIYTSMVIAILEPLKDAYREYNRGNPNQLIEPDIFNQILISKEDFIKLYINEFRPK
jgi:hypothetical protein